MSELAEAKYEAGFGGGAALQPEPEIITLPRRQLTPPAMSDLVRTASPAMQAALEQSMKELAAAKAKAGFGRQSSAAGAILPTFWSRFAHFSPTFCSRFFATAVAEVDNGESLTRTFSTEMYDKMLQNPKLVGAQRQKIQGMRTRRLAKETAADSTMTDLVRTASPAVMEAMRESMAEMAEARKAAGFGGGGGGGSGGSPLARTASELSAASGISKASIVEVMRLIPSFTVGDLRMLHSKFIAHVDSADDASHSAGGFLPREAFAAVLSNLASDPDVGPLRATRGFAFFEMMFERFQHGGPQGDAVDFGEFFCTLVILCSGTEAEKISFMFDAVDADADGFISSQVSHPHLILSHLILTSPSPHPHPHHILISSSSMVSSRRRSSCGSCTAARTFVARWYSGKT